jgi:hypothetical protein
MQISLLRGDSHHLFLLFSAALKSKDGKKKKVGEEGRDLILNKLDFLER